MHGCGFRSDEPFGFEASGVVFDEFVSGNFVKQPVEMACLMGTLVDASATCYAFFVVGTCGVCDVDGFSGAL